MQNVRYKGGNAQK